MERAGTSIVISGLGAYEPKRVVKNAELEEIVDTTDAWIRSRTGIEQRHVADSKEASSDMAVHAAREAIAKAGLTSGDIDVVIVATLSPDYPFPATACLVQEKLGLEKVPAFDLGAACSGFIYAIEVGKRYLAAGDEQRALIVGVEKMSGILDWEDRSTCVLFGDGAGAVILEKKTEAGEGYGLIESVLKAEGEHAQLLYQPAGGSAKPANAETLEGREHYLKMNGREVYKHAVRSMAEVCEEVLAKQGMSIEDVDWVVPHQANIRIIDSVAERVGLPKEKLVVSVNRHGNTSAASIPLAMKQPYEAGQFKRGDIILGVSFGAGLTYGASLIKWY